MNWKKILSIIVAIAVVVGTVFYFKKTVVTPPQQLKYANEHLTSLQRETSLLKLRLDTYKADSLLYCSLHAARLFEQEGFVSTQEADQIVSQTVQAYVPYFVQTYRQIFESSEWSRSQLNELRQKANFLMEQKKKIDGQPVLSKDNQDKVDSVILVLKLYDMAWKLCTNTKFESLKQSEKIIKQSRQYANTYPLSNCMPLSKRLFGLREELEKAHFAKLKSLVDGLNSYRNYQRDYYMNTLVKRTLDGIKEYKDNANRVYGIIHSTKALETKAGDYYNLATDYYNNN